MVVTIKQSQQRKLQLLQRYRSTHLEEMLLVTRHQAIEEAEHGRFPWKGDFRPREEIELLYGDRRKWDRRFLVDTIVLTVVLVAMVFAGSFLVQMVAPKPSHTREYLMEQKNLDVGTIPVDALADEPTQG